MKVLMQGRLRLLEVGGGDKVQIVNTAEELKKLGVEVDISTDINCDYSSYDLVHVFQLDWTPETYLYAKKAKDSNKPLVVSPIHHSVDEVTKFDNEYTFGVRRVAKYLLKDQHQRDTLKNINRSLADSSKRWPTFLSIFKGLKKMHVKTLSYANVVLVQTLLEAQDLKNTYGVEFPYEKIPNGVAAQFRNVVFDKDSDFFKNLREKNALEEDYILCVGRIEPRKNQLSIITAVEKLRSSLNKPIQLVFVGKLSGQNHHEYVYRFNNQLKKHSWIKHIHEVPYDVMPDVFKHAKVGVSASWFESTGLTSLEALFCKTNAVASGERAKEYLGEFASYCKPNDVKSITEAIKSAYLAPRPDITTQMLSEYTWENAAKKTLEVYNDVLAGKYNK